MQQRTANSSTHTCWLRSALMWGSLVQCEHCPGLQQQWSCEQGCKQPTGCPEHCPRWVFVLWSSPDCVSALGAPRAGTEWLPETLPRAAVPAAPRAKVALDRGLYSVYKVHHSQLIYCPLLYIVILVSCQPNLTSVSALSHASLGRRWIFPGTIFKTVKLSPAS